MLDAVIFEVADQQAHLIPRQAPSLGWLVGLEVRGQGEVDRV
jgi:hypothetical protein